MDGYFTEEDEELVCDGLGGKVLLRGDDLLVENRCFEGDVEFLFVNDCLHAILRAGPTYELLVSKRAVVALIDAEVPSLRDLRRRYFSDYEVHIERYVDEHGAYNGSVSCGIFLRRVAANGRFMAPTSPVPFVCP